MGLKIPKKESVLAREGAGLFRFRRPPPRTLLFIQPHEICALKPVRLSPSKGFERLSLNGKGYRTGSNQ